MTDIGRTDDEVPSAKSQDGKETKEKPRLALVKSNTAEELQRHWTKRLLRTGKDGKSGQIRRLLANAVLALKEAPEWRGALRYNESSRVVLLQRSPPWGVASSVGASESFETRLWTDQDDRLFTVWLQKANIDVSSSIAGEAVQAVAAEKGFHPIKEYLAGLKWDGTPRLHTWLATYFGADNSNYHATVGSKWLVSAIARVLRPGCKADCMLIFEGNQGIGKGKALSELAGPTSWFSDELRDLGGKDAAMGLAGRWIIEAAELEGFKGVGLERLKAFLTRTVDRYRPPYARLVQDVPRECVFAGTTNHEGIFSDVSGNRRFWPVSCGGLIDAVGIRKDRDQLWAEAKSKYDSGEKWWLETAEQQAWAEDAQEARFETDPWEEPILQYLQDNDLKKTTTAVILEQVFDITVEKSGRVEQLRVSQILRHLGWRRVQELDKTKTRRRIYVAPNP